MARPCHTSPFKAVLVNPPKLPSNFRAQLAQREQSGRNAGHWWQHEQAYERYDYLYQASELEEWVPRIHCLARFIAWPGERIASSLRSTTTTKVKRSQMPG